MGDFTVAWGWPQWTWVILAILSLITYAAKHGEPRDNYNAFAGFLGFGLKLFILIAGGFFV